MGGSNDLSLKVILAVDDSQSSKVKGFGSTIGGLSGIAGGIAKAFGGISLAAIGMAAASVSSASDFQTAMLNNVAHAGLAKDQMDAVSQSVLQMATDVGKSPTELAKALYPIYSSGMKGAEGLNELKLAAESVAGTTTNVTTVSNAASAAFNAFNMHTDNAATNIDRMNTLFDVMNQTVSDGNMQWSAYAVKVGDLAAKASQSHVAFTEANAALAVFTNTGESVQLAGTHLGALFQSMSLDVDKYVTHAKKLHESFDATKFKSLDLAGKMQYLEQITGGDEGKIKAILGNKTLAATFLKLHDHVKDYQGTLKDLNHAQGATKTSFETASSGFQQSMARAKAAIDVVMIQVGTALLPVLTKITDAIAPVITRFGDWLVKSGVLKTAADLLSTAITTIVNVITTLVGWGSAVVGFFKNNQWAVDLLIAALITVGGILLATLIPAFAAWVLEMGAAVVEALTLAAPFILIGAIITGIIFGIIMAIQHWGQIVSWLKSVWGAIAGFFTGLWQGIQGVFGAIAGWFHDRFTDAYNAVTGVFSAIGGWFSDRWKDIQNIFSAIGGWFAGIFTGAYTAVTTAFGKIKDWFKGLWDGIVSDFKNILGGILNAASGLWTGVTNIFKGGINWFIDRINWLIDRYNDIPKFGAPNLGHIPHLAAGGIVQQPGTVLVGEEGPEYLNLPAGAQVTPLPGGSSGSGNSAGGGNTFIFHVYGGPNANSDQVANLVMDKLNRLYRRSGIMGNPAVGARNS